MSGARARSKEYLWRRLIMFPYSPAHLFVRGHDGSIETECPYPRNWRLLDWEDADVSPAGIPFGRMCELCSRKPTKKGRAK